MKIIFLLQSFPCLSETFILNQITGLIDLGCDVRIVALGKPDDPKQHPAVARYRLLDKTTYIRLPTSKWDTRLKAAVQTLSVFLRHPVLVYRLQKTLLAGGRAYSYQKLFMALAVIRQRADILFCHFGTMGNTAVILKRIGLSAPLVTMFHGYDIRLGLEIGAEMYKDLFFYADALIANSNYTSRCLFELGSPPQKIQDQFNGLDIKTMTAALTSTKKMTNDIIILSVCRLVKEKGLHYGLSAFAEVCRKSTQRVLYYIVGDGPLMCELKCQAASLGINDRVIFCGSKTQEEVIEFYKQADIFFLPSVAEAFGMVLLEAQSMQLPIVTTKVGGIPEAVLEGKSAFLVPSKNSEMMAEKLLYLINNPDTWHKMGKIGQTYVEQYFDNTVMCKKLIKIFEELLNAKVQ